MASPPDAPQSPFRPDVLDGMVALVTGGSSGIGLEIARQLGAHGARVVISGRREDVLRAAVADLAASWPAGGPAAAHYLRGDVRDYAACEAMAAGAVERFGRLDVLVNCAAGNFLATPEALSSNGFRTVMDIDALGTFNASRAAFPHLRAAAAAPPRGGAPGPAGRTAAIINISATLHLGATWYQAHASAAKAAVDSLTRSLALEWGHARVRVAGVAPGPIAGTAGLAKLGPGAAATRAAIEERVPAGRLGRPWDVAMACVFLASPGASYVTGHVLVVDGGEWMWRPPLVPRGEVARLSRGVEGASRAITGGGGGGGGGARSKL